MSRWCQYGDAGPFSHPLKKGSFAEIFLSHLFIEIFGIDFNWSFYGGLAIGLIELRCVVSIKGLFCISSETLMQGREYFSVTLQFAALFMYFQGIFYVLTILWLFNSTAEVYTN